MKFRCQKCSHTFFSGIATAEIKLLFVPVNIYNKKVSSSLTLNTKKRRYSTPFVIFYDLYFYGMKCRRCWKAS